MPILARRGAEIVIDIIGEVLAFFTVLLILFMFINGKFNFLPDGVTNALTVVREIAIVGVIGLKGMEFALKRSVIMTVVFGAILVAIVTFMFFPESLPTWLS